MSSITGSVPVVRPVWLQIFSRTSASEALRSFLVEVPISWKVRNTVVSEGTDPKRSPWRRRCSMSAQLSPPPASISAIWTRTLPRSCSGIRSPRAGIFDESNEPSFNRSANDPRTWSPTWATTPDPPDSTRTRVVALLFTLEVLFCSGVTGSSRAPVFLMGRAFSRTRAG